MRKVLTLTCLLVVAHHVAAQQCNSLPTYGETFVPQCAQNDLIVNWPNYENLATYYKCNGIGNPVLYNCPANQYFTFVYQQCGPCSQYIPAVQCSQLKTQNKPNCVPIQGGSTGAPGTGGTTLPTPFYPNSTEKTTTEKTTKATTQKTTVSTASTPPTPSVPTIPTPPGPTTSDIPPPPSPVTNDPNVPMPPTPGPTPPSIVVTPPNVASPPVAG